MLRNRIIPVLLLQDGGFVKTKKFKFYKYLGDPINIIKIFNEKGADELVIFDINCSIQKKKPDFKLLEKISRQSKVPICYGGGIKTSEDAIKVLSLGYEKISVSSLLFENPEEIQKLIFKVGAQSVVLTFDFKFNFLGKIEFYVYNGKTRVKRNINDILHLIEDIQPGEIILSSIDDDGMRSGYNLKILQFFKEISIPITICGGATGIESFFKAKEIINYIGLGASDMFVLKKPLDAVLIQYPQNEDKFKLKKNVTGK